MALASVWLCCCGVVVHALIWAVEQVQGHPISRPLHGAILAAYLVVAPAPLLIGLVALIWSLIRGEEHMSGPPATPDDPDPR